MTNLTELQLLGRAKNAISMFLDKRLIVPKIYLDADWNQEKVDVLAIDRAGVGDVHAVHLSPPYDATGTSVLEASIAIRASELDIVERLLSISCQYKYVCEVVDFPIPIEGNRFNILSGWIGKNFATDGIGRVGVFFINAFEDDVQVDEIVKAERFRSTKEILDMTDAYVQTHTAAMEYRDPVYDQEVSA